MLKQELVIWISDLSESIKKNEHGLAETEERVNQIERKVEKIEKKDDDATIILKHYDQKVFWENAVMVKGAPNKEKAFEQSGSQWGNTDQWSLNDVRDGLQDIHYYCQEYLDRREKLACQP